MIENLFPFWVPLLSPGPATEMYAHFQCNTLKPNLRRAQTRFRKRYKNSLVTRLFNKSMSLITKSKSCTHSSHLSTRVRDMAFMSFRILLRQFSRKCIVFRFDWWYVCITCFLCVSIPFPYISGGGRGSIWFCVAQLVYHFLIVSLFQ